MKPLEAISRAEAGALQGFLFDLDDTFLDDGHLDPQAFQALFELRAAGLWTFGVTGRPAGWGALLARQWPVLGIISENGAIAHLGQAQGRVKVWDPLDASRRGLRREALRQLIQKLREVLPDLVPADDVDSRITDFTFDIGEHQRLQPAQVATAARQAQALGARTFASSIHLHVTLDYADKATGALELLQHELGLDPTRARAETAFVGDSSNDAPCFFAFSTSIGVANLSGRSTVPPRYITRRSKSRGFVECVRILLERRSQALRG